MKSPLSICLSFLWLVSSSVFFPIFYEITYYCTLLYDLTTNSLVFAENSFLLVFGLEGSQGDRFSKKSCLGHE